MASTGLLQVSLLNSDKLAPIEGASVKVTEVSKNGEQGKSGEYVTGISGETVNIELPTPDIANSMEPSGKIPYGLYDIEINNPGFETLSVRGVQVLPEELAIQLARVEPLKETNQRQDVNIIIINANTLVGDFPAKIPEDPEKALPPPPSGFVVLPEPVIPEFIVVHQGSPNDTTAPNYTVRFKEYIKNVASCEIFATWPESTIRANIYCILSFTINRIYTEWYRGKGKNFDITSSTAYDHAFNYGRNIYESINVIVDEIFTNYIKRFGQKQPLLTQYCDGIKVKCPGWLTQWGSKYLGDDGKTPYEILTNFYGSDLEIVTANRVEGIPSSYPGYTLGIGTSGEPVRTIQRFLNRISDNFPAVPKVKVDGIYGENTANAVRAFQKIFNLPISGTVNYPTWYAISDIYVGVSKIAELRGDFRGDYRGEKKIFIPHTPHKNVYDFPTVEYYQDKF